MATRMLPDSTFYPSPALAGEAPPERLAYVALLAPEANGRSTARPMHLVSSTPTHHRPSMAGLSEGWTSPKAATSCTTLVGMPAARTSAATPPTPTSSAATS